MDKKTEALKLALEALEYIHEGANNQGPHTGISWRCVSNKAEPAITAIREALAEQPAQLDPSVGTQVSKVWWDGDKLMAQPIPLEKLYKEPEQPAQQQEPVAWMDGYRNIYSLEEKAAGCPEATIALVPMANHKKTSGSPINELQCVCGAVWLGEEMVHLPDKRPPASKPWVGLTEEEIKECFKITPDLFLPWHIYKRIEAKLREKNT